MYIHSFRQHQRLPAKEYGNIFMAIGTPQCIRPAARLPARPPASPPARQPVRPPARPHARTPTRTQERYTNTHRCIEKSIGIKSERSFLDGWRKQVRNTIGASCRQSCMCFITRAYRNGTPPLPTCSMLKSCSLVGVAKFTWFTQPRCHQALDSNIELWGRGAHTGDHRSIKLYAVALRTVFRQQSPPRSAECCANETA